MIRCLRTLLPFASTQLSELGKADKSHTDSVHRSVSGMLGSVLDGVKDAALRALSSDQLMAVFEGVVKSSAVHVQHTADDDLVAAVTELQTQLDSDSSLLVRGSGLLRRGVCFCDF